MENNIFHRLSVEMTFKCYGFIEIYAVIAINLF